MEELCLWIAQLFEIGQDAGLNGKQLDKFVNFFLERFPETRSCIYAREWAYRFRNGTDLSSSDEASRRIITQLERELSLSAKSGALK